MQIVTARVVAYSCGWTAYVTLPGQRESLIGECYMTKTTAITACKRFIKKHHTGETKYSVSISIE